MSKSLLTKAKKIVDILERERNHSFDPEKRIKFDEIPTYHYFMGKNKKDKDVYIPDEDELRSEHELQELLGSVLFADEDRIVQGDTFVSSDYFKEKLTQAHHYVSTKYASQTQEFRKHKLDAIEFLLCQIISLRVLKEIRYQNLPFPYEPITEEMADKEFKDLIDKVANHPSTMAFTTNIPKTYLGWSVSDRVMQYQRYEVTNSTFKNKDGSYRTPVSSWYADTLSSVINGFLRQIAMTNRNREYDYHFENRNMALTGHVVRTKLTRKFGAQQHKPFHIPCLINFLQTSYKDSFAIESYLDLCAGWGDRLVGALASSSLGLKRYVATDPNTTIHAGYQEITTRYKPAGFEVIIHQKPMEECDSTELCPDGKPNQLMYTSPPYFGLEKYQGANQSYLRYNTYNVWKEQFLYVLVQQAIKGLIPGGYLAIEMGRDKDINIPEDLYSYLCKCKFITVLHKFHPKNHDNSCTYLARFTGDNSLEKTVLSVDGPKADDNVNSAVNQNSEPVEQNKVVVASNSYLPFKKRKGNLLFFNQEAKQHVSPSVKKPVLENSSGADANHSFFAMQ
ncbi:hypothetical protein [Legionella bononiensis]|uniref:Site-specific DNA-methyltransferase (cytosine-N(4)-specific) n=1 Tax=Legionella bononiensis TaxID=2793102 RepID=A0ABS1WCR0_9GAMM|nr:hypothetical protein [Legionella bononiensis]MBL7479019.1 hypothetical protein [Legionella bononiensis]MBL7527152.1 hypothetical protein [Legionella bononiensis]MBL7562121.1 hypothetical protein [Legionella bononiensis]